MNLLFVVAEIARPFSMFSDRARFLSLASSLVPLLAVTRARFWGLGFPRCCAASIASFAFRAAVRMHEKKIAETPERRDLAVLLVVEESLDEFSDLLRRLVGDRHCMIVVQHGDNKY